MRESERDCCSEGEFIIDKGLKDEAVRDHAYSALSQVPQICQKSRRIGCHKVATTHKVSEPVTACNDVDVVALRSMSTDISQIRCPAAHSIWNAF